MGLAHSTGIVRRSCEKSSIGGYSVLASTAPVIVARDLVRKGFAVFPVWDKRPITKHGVHSAARTLLEFGQLNWRDANGVGVATGKASGFDVLDVDLRAATSVPGNPSIVIDADVAVESVD